MRQIVYLALIVLAMLSLSNAQEQPKVTLPELVKPDPDFGSIKTFRCDFQTGEGRDSFEKPNARIKDGGLGELLFDNLNYKNGTARLIGNVGSSDVILLDGMLAVSFIERTDVGGVTITTIFKGANVGLRLSQTYRAVSSRHIARTIGGESTTQHYGTCKGLL